MVALTGPTNPYALPPPPYETAWTHVQSPSGSSFANGWIPYICEECGHFCSQVWLHRPTLIIGGGSSILKWPLVWAMWMVLSRRLTFWLIREVIGKGAHGPVDPVHRLEYLIYDPVSDSYTCRRTTSTPGGYGVHPPFKPTGNQDARGS